MDLQLREGMRMMVVKEGVCITGLLLQALKTALFQEIMAFMVVGLEMYFHHQLFPIVFFHSKNLQMLKLNVL